MLRLSSKKFVSILIAGLVFFILQNFPLQKISPKLIPKSKNDNKSFLVKRVIDGDTIELENKQIVRYIGVDSPELHHPKKPVECFASSAAEFNRQLVEGKTVLLEKDVSETDKYKRLLRYVYLTEEASSSGKIFVNKKLVEEGYAYAATFPPDVKYAEIFRQAQEEAMKNKRGLWKSCKIK